MSFEIGKKSEGLHEGRWYVSVTMEFASFRILSTSRSEAFADETLHFDTSKQWLILLLYLYCLLKGVRQKN